MMTKTTTKPVTSKLLNTSGLPYGIATKTKCIKAKILSQIIVDPKGFDMLLLDTLEGLQAPIPTAMACIGIDTDDPWQQDQEKLFQKYTVIAVDDNGWLMCQPMPDNEREAFQVTPEMCYPGNPTFRIVGQWGGEQPDGTFLQFGEAGDYILRDPDDPTDCYIVKKAIFESTYEWKA
jgi:hypothetical protein